MKTTDLVTRRMNMVEYQLVARGINEPRVLDAMRKVPREAFLPENLCESAYDDSPLPIAAGQSISQPYIVALMLEALSLKGDEYVLEIGTGSGYAAAVLAELAGDIETVERVRSLADHAAITLETLGYANVHVHCGDGTLGWPEQAPYDAIVVAAGGPSVPESLLSQLKIGGRIVMPVGKGQRNQALVRVTQVAESNFQSEEIAAVRFVPLIGDEGWKDAFEAEAPPPRASLHFPT